MRLHPTRLKRRSGFTLVEILVVIGIIALLVSLLSSAVIMALHKVDETRAVNEITQMGSGLVQFQADWNVQSSPPLSRLWLDETGQYNIPPTGYTAAQMPQLQPLALDSQAYLSKVWPRLKYNDPVTGRRGIDWNSDGVPGNSSYVLEGEQVYVFFLAGLRVGGVPQGFSTDPTNPMSPAGPRKGPYFQFVQSRLVIPPNMPASFAQYPVYYDAFSSSLPVLGDQPYLYFSSGGKANGYNAYLLTLGGSDCATFGVWPYVQSGPNPVLYYKADTFQIVCAGRNQQFGPGCPPTANGFTNVWQPNLGASNPGIGLGIDDLSNFYNLPLGTTP